MRILLDIYSLFSRAVCRGKSALVKAGAVAQRKAPLPVISVGNLILGGSEKTPLVMEILAHLERLGLRPALVTRGYKGKWGKKGGVLSDGKTLYGGWAEAGDEPYMIARRFPRAGIFTGRRRYLSSLRAKEMGFDVIVLDDGFQHIRLARDLDIVLHDARGRRLLREGFSALSRADILLLKNGGNELIRKRAREKFAALSVFEYSVVSLGLRSLEAHESGHVDILKDRKILAFCGIARPERFFSLLEECGIPPFSRLAFPDHFSYPPRAMENIGAACKKLQPDALVTTEKDAVKIIGRTGAFAGLPVYVLGIGLVLPPAFFEQIREVVQTKKTHDERNPERR